MLDDHRREAISGVADFGHDKGLWPQITAGKPNNVTMPRELFRKGVCWPDFLANTSRKVKKLKA
jgi:NAD-dependent SIR2 family protein deacetylase